MAQAPVSKLCRFETSSRLGCHNLSTKSVDKIGGSWVSGCAVKVKWRDCFLCSGYDGY